MNILLVCTGNTCRSVMAEALFDDAVDRSRRLSGEVKVDSAGTFACEDQEATDHAIRAMEEMGIDVGRHKAKQIDAELTEWADLILTMEATHIEQIEAMLPEAENKLHTIKGYAEGEYGFPPEGFDVVDPYGEDIGEYRECAAQLKEIVRKIIKKLEAEIG